MTTIALWICVCADDWAAESAIKASNDIHILMYHKVILLRSALKCTQIQNIWIVNKNLMCHEGFQLYI